MFKLLYDPVVEIRQIRKPSFAKLLLYLLTASLFETVGVLFFAWHYFSGALSQSVVVNGVCALLFGLIVVHLFVAFFFSVAMHVLDGRGGYYEGLAVVVLSMVAPAVMTFFAGAFTFIPLGKFVSVLLLIFGYVIGFSTFFRAGKDLFGLDYSGVLVGFLATVIPFALAVCGAVMMLK